MRLFGPPDVAALKARSDVPALLRALHDKDPQVRCAAADALGDLGDSEALPALVDALRDFQPPGVRVRVVHALGELHDEAAIDPLRAVLADPDQFTRVDVVQALASIGGAPAVDALVQALHDREPLVRGAATRWLGVLADARASEPLKAVLAHDADARVRRDAVEALVDVAGTAAIEALEGAIGDADDKVAVFAAETLGSFADERAVEPLIAVLANPEHVSMRRSAAARALGQIGDPRAIVPLALASHSDETYAAAREALAAFGDTVIEPLAAALANDTFGSVAETLGRTGDERAVAPLVAALGRAGDLARLEVVQALGSLQAQPAARARIAEIGVGPLVAMLADDNTSIVANTVGILGDLRDPRAVEPLIVLLGHRDSSIRRAAEDALDRLPSAVVIDPLIAALGRDNIPAVCGAIRILGRLQDARAVEPLIEMLGMAGDVVSSYRRTAAEALGRLQDPRAVEPLIALLEDDDAGVRAAALSALAWSGEPRAIEAVREHRRTR